MTKVFLTKFALKHGIIEAEGHVIGDGTTLRVEGAYPWQYTDFGKNDWHTDREKAEARARKMATDKANQHEREAARLRNLFAKEGE